MNEFKDKIVFVTGGANGIGADIVRRFSQMNSNVIFCDIDEENGNLLALETGACFYKIDASVSEELNSLMLKIFEKNGDIDILINNLGISKFKKLIEISIEEFKEIIDTNLTSAFVTSRALAIHRKDNKEKFGRIINISSIRHFQCEENWEAYSASKGAIVSLTNTLALSLSDYNITVNCISPGWINTNKDEVISQADNTQHPSRRVGKVEDITNTIIFLASENSEFINAQDIIVDGGISKKLPYI